jgi:hypothetical protein
MQDALLTAASWLSQAHKYLLAQCYKHAGQEHRAIHLLDGERLLWPANPTAAAAPAASSWCGGPASAQASMCSQAVQQQQQQQQQQQ